MSKSPARTSHPDDNYDRVGGVGDATDTVRLVGFNTPQAGDLAHRVAATLARPHAGVLAAALATCVDDAAHYEASVRGTPGGVLSAGRMMIEQASPAVLDAIADALDVVLPHIVTRWLQLAEIEGVPLIAGWDLRSSPFAEPIGGARCVKLYVNASDATRAVRARLRAALAPDVTFEPPAVMGMNVTANGTVETKLYVQSADAVALADGCGAAARALAAAARDERADAGGVVSFDAAGATLHARAFFVALREPHDAAGWSCVQSLPGYDPRAIASLLPFAPAPPRSVGISLHDGSWTLYCKPRDSGRAPEALEPTAIFRVGDLEVGVFVEPNESAARAFRRTARHAVSVRVRAGTPAPRALEALVDWFTARLRTAELEGARVMEELADPPAPWRLVNTTKPFGGLGERP